MLAFLSMDLDAASLCCTHRAATKRCKTLITHEVLHTVLLTVWIH